MELRVKGVDGDRIRAAREAANLTQREFADELGVSARTVQYWEAGKWPRAKHRRLLSDWLSEHEGEAA